MGLISTIALASRGRISPSTSRTITLATVGWILVILVPPPQPTAPVSFGGASAGAVGPSVLFWDKKRILNDDDEIFLMLKVFVENL